MFGKSKNIIIDENIRFSQTHLWHDQKKYYEKKGIAAWEKDVPFYITSNPYIGKKYAKLVIAFIQDCLEKNATACEDPFYILELGSGTGIFSFYCLKYIIAELALLKLDHVKIFYVMSDVTSVSFDFWKNHPALQSFLNQGQLDFAIYDLYSTEVISLHLSKKTLDNNSIKNPLIVIANYIFDSISTDVFFVEHDQLYEGLVTTKTIEKSLQKDDIDFSKISIDYHKKLIDGSYYSGQYDEILFDYRHQLKNTCFQFPISVLKTFKRIQTHLHNNFLLISSDKGYTDIHEMENCALPNLPVHGSFSVMVNYHAIGEFFKKNGGDCAVQPLRESIVTNVFTSGFLLNDFFRLSVMCKESLGKFSAIDYFFLYEFFRDNVEKCEITSISAFLNLSLWDPRIFMHAFAALKKAASNQSHPEVIQYVVNHTELIAKNFYYLPFSGDALFNIGLFLLNAGQYEQAISYFLDSKKYYEATVELYFNLGLCCYHLKRQQESLDYFYSALNLNPQLELIKEWIQKVR